MQNNDTEGKKMIYYKFYNANHKDKLNSDRNNWFAHSYY